MKLVLDVCDVYVMGGCVYVYVGSGVYTLLCLPVAMLDALLVVCGDQRSLKNTDNLFSNSYSYSEAGKKVEIVHSTLLSIFPFPVWRGFMSILPFPFTSFFTHSCSTLLP